VTSRTTARFRKELAALPDHVRRQAGKAFAQFLRDPRHPSLRYKRVHPRQPIFSVRIAKGYRALGRRGEEGMVWFWIGSHADYDQLIS
jgi:hypothetical protein